jgi:hypothetical protein
MTLPSLDVFIGLVTIYIVLALTVSALTELLTRVIGLRSIGLKSGIRSILQDPTAKGLESETKKFWNSGIIKSATDGDSSPNSLDALTFATATLATTGMHLPLNSDQAKAMIAKAPINAHLKDVLNDLSDRAAYRGTTLHDELAQHFDATMEKVGRWYKNWAQGIAFVLAIVVTVYVNANTLDLLHQLTAHPEARLALATLQSSLAEADEDHGDVVRNVKAVEAIITKDALAGTLTWPHQNGERFRLIVGLLITILAVSQGAPFWFDVLSRIDPRNGGANRPPSSISVRPMPTTALPPPRATL